MDLKSGLRVMLGMVLALGLLVFSGCSSSEPPSGGPAADAHAAKQGGLKLLKFGPTDIRAGQVFNKQPDGGSAIWANTENATPKTVLVLNDVRLKSAPRPDGKLVTAAVPASLYEKPGSYTLYLLDEKTNEKSNELMFIVK